jgi:steroid 5-alpha reductase family enzyme
MRQSGTDLLVIATWISVVGLPVYLVNAFPNHVHPALGARDYLALGLYVVSFLVEVVADRQKSAWRKGKDNKEHDEEFISSGLWNLSRHPK